MFFIHLHHHSGRQALILYGVATVSGTAASMERCPHLYSPIASQCLGALFCSFTCPYGIKRRRASMTRKHSTTYTDNQLIE